HFSRCIILSKRTERQWPPVPGDFSVKDPTGCVAVCTLGKKFDVPAEYAIIGSCKTENIGIERVIINIISNPSIRFLILAGPEVPGHLTGDSMRSLYNEGVEEATRKIIGARGAIPYIENVSLEGVERFRQQLEFFDMVNNSDPEAIALKVEELNNRNPGPNTEPPIWVEFTVRKAARAPTSFSEGISLLPELGLNVDPMTSLVTTRSSGAIITSSIGIKVKVDDDGSMMVGKEL
ncbi:MAG: tetrahydromethanopterin S-methyltransferase subunit A, partial [Candidatus Thorarchaeota archaeon]